MNAKIVGYKAFGVLDDADKFNAAVQKHIDNPSKGQRVGHIETGVVLIPARGTASELLYTAAITYVEDTLSGGTVYPLRRNVG